MTPPISEAAVRNELARHRSSTTRAQVAALRKARDWLVAKYLGQYVAYVDSWSGDELARIVVAASADWREYQRQLDELTAEYRERMEAEFVRDSDEAIFMAGYGVLA